MYFLQQFFLGGLILPGASGGKLWTFFSRNAGDLPLAGSGELPAGSEGHSLPGDGGIRQSAAGAVAGAVAKRGTKGTAGYAAGAGDVGAIGKNSPATACAPGDRPVSPECIGQTLGTGSGVRRRPVELVHRRENLGCIEWLMRHLRLKSLNRF